MFAVVFLRLIFTVDTVRSMLRELVVNKNCMS